MFKNSIGESSFKDSKNQKCLWDLVFFSFYPRFFSLRQAYNFDSPLVIQFYILYHSNISLSFPKHCQSSRAKFHLDCKTIFDPVAMVMRKWNSWLVISKSSVQFWTYNKRKEALFIQITCIQRQQVMISQWIHKT